MNIKTWQERVKPEYHSLNIARDFMQAEIDELRAALAERDAEIKRLTGIAFLASAERDELRMGLGDLPQAQADMLATIKAQRKVLEQALEALELACQRSDKIVDREYESAITAIQEQLK